MIALFGLFTIIILSIVVVRIGATALELTGLSPEIATFQAQSAFSGVGFTTAESESIVTHPVRRRIIRVLFLLGSAGFTTSIAAFILTFVGQPGKNIAVRALVLLIGLLLIVLFAKSRTIYNLMRKIIKWALEKITALHLYDYSEILGLGEGYMISRFTVKEDSWLANKRLKELSLDLEDVLVLSIYRRDNGVRFIGAPHGDTLIKPGDEVVCYGRRDVSKCLSQRTKGVKGYKEHKEIVEEIKQKESQ